MIGLWVNKREMGVMREKMGKKRKIKEEEEEGSPPLRPRPALAGGYREREKRGDYEVGRERM